MAIVNWQLAFLNTFVSRVFPQYVLHPTGFASLLQRGTICFFLERRGNVYQRATSCSDMSDYVVEKVFILLEFCLTIAVFNPMPRNQ
jgi:hypothetical protein